MKKEFNKGTSLFLLVLFFLTNLISFFPNVLNAAQEYGYVELHYVNTSMEEIKDIQQWPVALTNGTGSYLFGAPPIANYDAKKYELNGVSYDGNSTTVYVNSSNTPENPVRLTFIYNSTLTSKTVTLYGCLGNGSDNYTHQIVGFDNLGTTPQNKTFLATQLPLPDSSQWIFDHSESSASMNGGPSVTIPMSINSPDNQDVKFVYRLKTGSATGPVAYTATNNELNDSKTGVVTQSNGLDNFGRYESDPLYDNGHGVDQEVLAPTQNPARPDLELAFIIVEKQSGSPISALTNFVDIQYGSTLKFNFTADAAHWYVHFYWQKKNTDYPPGKITVITTNNELSQDGKSVVSSFGQASNEYNDTSGGGLQLTQTPPAQNPPRSDLNFAFAVVSKSSDPSGAIMNNVSQSSSASVSYKFSASTPIWYVNFYYSKQGETKPPEGGALVFNPQSTNWTNLGKTGNGTGSYPVQVSYTGQNPAIGQGTVTFHHNEPKPDIISGTPPVSTPQPPLEFDTTKEFQVKYPLNSITVSGDASATLPGTGGTVNITHEGKGLTLTGKGTWGEPDVSGKPSPGQYESETNKVIPPAPEDPTGAGGTYDIDWTNPLAAFSLSPGIVSRTNATYKASQKGELNSYYGTLTAADGLSGLAQVQYGWTFGSSDGSCNYQTISLAGSGIYSQEIEKPVGDNLYFHVRTRDLAGNTNYQVFGPYEDAIWLGDMRITDIKDPSYAGVFKDSNSNSTGKYVAVSQMPVDNLTWANIYPKKGYAFYFDFATEYLYRLSDYITVTPKFYYFNGSTRGQEVDIYYNLDNNPFIKIGSGQDTVRLYMRAASDPKDSDGSLLIGSFAQLQLTDSVRLHRGLPYSSWKGQVQYTQGKMQYWYGKYFMPGTSIIVPKGQSPRPENVIKDGYILINFQVTAYKNGVESGGTNQYFNYVPSQWTTEGGPKSANYQPGDVIVFNNMKSVLDDFGAVITH